jgi:hypothetical protein
MPVKAERHSGHPFAHPSTTRVSTIDSTQKPKSGHCPLQKIQLAGINHCVEYFRTSPRRLLCNRTPILRRIPMRPRHCSLSLCAAFPLWFLQTMRYSRCLPVYLCPMHRSMTPLAISPSQIQMMRSIVRRRAMALLF